MKATASEPTGLMPTVFIDTEFTDLMAPRLLSFGAASLDGCEHYVELDLKSDIGRQHVKRASNFVRTGGVLGQWGRVPGATVTLLEMGRRTGEWLLGRGSAHRPLRIAFDYVGDFELMEEALRHCGLWSRVGDVVSPVNVSEAWTDAGRRAAEACLAEVATRNLYRHHALADALALRAACLAAQDDAVRLERCVRSGDLGRLAATVTGLLPTDLRDIFDTETRLRCWLLRVQPELGHCRPLDVLDEVGGTDRLVGLLRAELTGATTLEEANHRLLSAASVPIR